MSTCSSCYSVIPAGSGFCVECGAKAPAGKSAPVVSGSQKVKCSSCGTDLASGAKFCPECGGKPAESGGSSSSSSYSAPTSYSAPSYSAPEPEYTPEPTPEPEPTPTYSAPKTTSAPTSRAQAAAALVGRGKAGGPSAYKGSWEADEPAKPTYSEPKPASKPTYSEPKPTYSEPKPTYSEPKPTYSEPKPTYSEPKSAPKSSYGSGSDSLGPSEGEIKAKPCGGCGGTIEGRVIDALDRHWHPECFKCFNCGGSFATSGGGNAFMVKDGNPYCQKCQSKVLGVCTMCNETLSGPIITALGGNFHQKCFVCGGCRGGFTGGKFKLNPSRPGVPFCDDCVASA